MDFSETQSDTLKKLADNSLVELSINYSDWGNESYKTALLAAIDSGSSLERISASGIGLNLNDLSTLVSSLKKHPKLVSLDIGFNDVGNAGVKIVAENLPNLTALNVSKTGIDHEGAAEIARLEKLTTLNMKRNNIGDSGVFAIKNLTNLATLGLYDTQITDVGAKAIAENMQNIVALDISKNSVGNEGVIAIAQKLPKLSLINISDNFRINSEGRKAFSTLNLKGGFYDDIGVNSALAKPFAVSQSWQSRAAETSTAAGIAH